MDVLLDGYVYPCTERFSIYLYMSFIFCHTDFLTDRVGWVPISAIATDFFRPDLRMHFFPTAVEIHLSVESFTSLKLKMCFPPHEKEIFSLTLFPVCL